MPDFLKGNWSKAAIGGLVLLNLVLLVFLVLRHPPGAATAVPAVTAAASGGSTPTPSRSSPGVIVTARPTPPTPTTRPTPTPTAKTAAPTPTKSSTDSDSSTRILAVNSARIAWRAVFGPCPTDPDLEVSRDGGRTWRSSKPDLRSVSRLRAFSDSSVFAVGGAEGCNPQYVVSGGPGERWLANEAQLEELWYRVPRQADRVHAPGGQLSRPCGKRLLDFAGLGDLGAAALCGDGALRTTRDSGRSWREVAGNSAGLALGADEQTYALAMRRDGCDGIAVVLLGPAARAVEAKAVRCARLEGDATDELGIGVRGQVVWLWQGSKVAVSTDGGRTWKVASGPDSP